MAQISIHPGRYSRVAMALHWLIAMAILYNLASGLLRPALPKSFFVWHVSSGITILCLSVLRVAWRLTHRPPPLLPMQAWEARLAHTVHAFLYAAMIVVPLSGWAMVSANPPPGSPGAAFAQQQANAKAAAEGRPAPAPREPTMVWTIIRLPLIAPLNRIGQTQEGVAEQHEVHERIETLHELGAWLMLGLLVLHVGGALKHQFADGAPELARMGLGRLRD